MVNFRSILFINLLSIAIAYFSPTCKVNYNRVKGKNSNHLWLKSLVGLSVYQNSELKAAVSSRLISNTLPLFASPPFSLDRSVLPPKSGIFSTSLPVCIAVVLLSFIIRALSNGILLESAKAVGNIFGNFFSFLRTDFLPLTKLGTKIISAKATVVMENLTGLFSKFFDSNPAEEIDIKDWVPCVLEERENLPGGYLRYRFELDNPSAVIPLFMGQEVQLCVVDSNDKVLKDSFFPITPSTTKGHFDIITMKPFGDSLSERFSRVLETMSVGDELAFKSGKYRLNYQGDDDPIKSVTMIVSGLGVTPALQMLRGVLPGQESTVDDVEMLWINEERSDFLCAKVIESLEYRYIEKLTITRLVQFDLFGNDISKIDRVRDEVSSYEEGRLGVICGPDYVVSRARGLLQELGFPAENILTVVLP